MIGFKKSQQATSAYFYKLGPPKKDKEKNHETASLQNAPGLISADPGQSTNENQCTQVDIRSRLHNLAFIFSLPHLVMLSNLQKLIGIRTGRKPSIQV